jgi:hypothetical protein
LELLKIGIFSKEVDPGESFPLPADSVLLWDRNSESIAVPSGFSIYSAANNRLIQGTTTLPNAGTTGGTSATMSISAVSTASSGAHGTGQPSFSGAAFGPPLIANPVSPSNGPSAGSHSHPTSATPVSVPSTIKPNGRWMVLITNSAEVSDIPLNCVVFSSTKPFSFIRKTFDTQPVGTYTARTTTSGFKSAESTPLVVTFGPTGVHDHRLPNPVGSTPSTTPRPQMFGHAANIGAHTHPNTGLNLTVYQQFKHLLPFMASANSPVKSGMIVMFKGASIPSGWKLCDGTNGTPNMNGFFLGYDNNENGHDVLKSNKRVDVNPSVYPLPTTNPPSPTNYEVLANFGTTTITWAHGHLGSPIATAFASSPGQLHQPNNVPHSHPWPSANVLFPTNFTPDFIRLVFIQKE